MGMIKGIDVGLINKVKSATKDPFGNPTYTESAQVTVHNVLVSSTTSTDVLENKDIHGRRIAATIAIPKGDTHTWEDSEVVVYGKRWKTVGGVMEGIESMIPLGWHKQIRIERYE